MLILLRLQSLCLPDMYSHSGAVRETIDRPCRSPLSPPGTRPPPPGTEPARSHRPPARSSRPPGACAPGGTQQRAEFWAVICSLLCRSHLTKFAQYSLSLNTHQDLADWLCRDGVHSMDLSTNHFGRVVYNIGSLHNVRSRMLIL